MELTEKIPILADATRQWDEESQSGMMPFVMAGAEILDGGVPVGNIGCTPDGSVWLKAAGGKWWKIDALELFRNFILSRHMYIEEGR
ncbi:MAG: hypothetical protein ACXADF_14885 [Candidatus Thorarchaeota archaeon]|jgi:hypothetical protein